MPCEVQQRYLHYQGARQGREHGHLEGVRWVLGSPVQYWFSLPPGLCASSRGELEGVSSKVMGESERRSVAGGAVG
jgi:hypothetical protein